MTIGKVGLFICNVKYPSDLSIRKPGLFICNVKYANDLSIEKAGLFTRNDFVNASGWSVRKVSSSAHLSVCAVDSSCLRARRVPAAAEEMDEGTTDSTPEEDEEELKELSPG